MGERLRGRLVAALAGWIAGVLAVGCVAVVAEVGTDETAAAQRPASTSTTSTTAGPAPADTTAISSRPPQPTPVPTAAAPPATAAPMPAPATAMPSVPSHSTQEPRTSGPILLAWIYGGLPSGFADRIAQLQEVTSQTVVAGDLVRLVQTADAAGRPVDVAPTSWAYPIDALAIDPATFAPFTPDPDRGVLAQLRPGQAILTETSSQLRRLGVGGALTFGSSDVTFTVAAVVSDHAGSGAEVLVHEADAPGIGIHTPRFVLLTDTDRGAVEAAIESFTPAGERLELQGSDQAAWLRHGDRVDPQMLVKKTFGEFTFHDGNPADREITIDPAWVEANVVTERVPLLGQVRCHRLVVPLVREAMRELEESGHGDAVDPGSYAGCQYARRIAPGAGLSRHSWGIAIDINVGANPRGDYATQAPALTAAFTSRGFNWGGDWPGFPDPAHYEKRA